MAYLNLHGKEYLYNGTPAQFAAFLRNYGRRLAWGAPSPANVPMNVPPVFRQVRANGTTDLAWDISESIGKDELEVTFEYEVLYPIYNGGGEWRPAKGFINVVGLPTKKSLLIVWTTLDRSYDTERKHVVEVWEHLKSELERFQLLESGLIKGEDEKTQNPRETLRSLMGNVFSVSDIQDLCFDLGVDYEDLDGTSKNDKIRELILHCERIELHKGLISLCWKKRPMNTWPDPW